MQIDDSLLSPFVTVFLFVASGFWAADSKLSMSEIFTFLIRLSIWCDNSSSLFVLNPWEIREDLWRVWGKHKMKRWMHTGKHSVQERQPESSDMYVPHRRLRVAFIPVNRAWEVPAGRITKLISRSRLLPFLSPKYTKSLQASCFLPVRLLEFRIVSVSQEYAYDIICLLLLILRNDIILEEAQSEFNQLKNEIDINMIHCSR